MNPIAHMLGAALLCGVFCLGRIEGPEDPGYTLAAWGCFIFSVLVLGLVLIALRTWFEEAQVRRTYNDVLVEMLGSILPIKHPPDSWYSPRRVSGGWQGRATLGVLTEERRRLALALMLAGLGALGGAAFEGSIGTGLARAFLAVAAVVFVGSVWRTRSRHTMLPDLPDAGLRFLVYAIATGAVRLHEEGAGWLAGQWGILLLPALGLLCLLLWLKAGPANNAIPIADVF